MGGSRGGRGWVSGPPTPEKSHFIGFYRESKQLVLPSSIWPKSHVFSQNKLLLKMWVEMVMGRKIIGKIRDL